MPLPYLGALFDAQRKRRAPQEDWIRHITAFCTLFTLDEFETFASIASASLTTLKLARQHKDRLSAVKRGEDLAHRALISFDDLPNLITIIRTTLPHLTTFHTMLKGIDEAEEICGLLLRSDSLEDGGTINDLHLATAKYDTPLFNVIRVVSALCTREAYISINEFGNGYWSHADQREFLSYLRWYANMRWS